MAGNSNSGRRPKPTAVKVAEGNPGKRPLNDKEPEPRSKTVTERPPLTADAVIVWDRLAPEAEHLGTLTSADAQAFAVLCELIADFQRKPVFAVASVLKSYFAMFGMEPASRSRLMTKATGRADDDFTEFGF